MLAKHFEDFGGIYNIEEPYGLVLHAGGHGVELQALVAFTDLKVVQSSNGCCEPTSSRWIGTAQQWIGAFALGIRFGALWNQPRPTRCSQCMRHGRALQATAWHVLGLLCVHHGLIVCYVYPLGL